MKKKCSKCLTMKEEIEFGKKKNLCLECLRIISRNWYAQNKVEHNKKMLEKRLVKRQFIQEYKESRPCADCGNFFAFYVMDFDHLPGTEKCIAIARSGRQYNMEKLISELKKCDVVCSNCHRVRTWNREQRFVKKRKLQKSPPTSAS